ncbi:MAG: hypothetical protein EPO39_11185 [Candidatus Manganitrophaceae bacterium]|nr:MAG: hypothetical protein EPO39_11185 [Candidatus Manganitrophaceae bacterium]
MKNVLWSDRSGFDPLGMFGRGVLLLLAVLLLGGCSSFGRRTTPGVSSDAGRQVYEIRLATEKYRDIEKAQADGYFRFTGYLPNMGYQYANPKLFSGFDLRRPPILIYDERDGRFELTGVMYVSPLDQSPGSVLPFRGAEFMRHPMMCHYQDGTNLNLEKAEQCPKEHPLTKATLVFWHPDLWMMSAWIWYPNPNGLFSLYNPLLNFTR